MHTFFFPYSHSCVHVHRLSSAVLDSKKKTSGVSFFFFLCKNALILKHLYTQTSLTSCFDPWGGGSFLQKLIWKNATPAVRLHQQWEDFKEPYALMTATSEYVADSKNLSTLILIKLFYCISSTTHS